MPFPAKKYNSSTELNSIKRQNKTELSSPSLGQLGADRMMRPAAHQGNRMSQKLQCCTDSVKISNLVSLGNNILGTHDLGTEINIHRSHLTL